MYRPANQYKDGNHTAKSIGPDSLGSLLSIRQIVGYDKFDVNDVKNSGFPPGAGVDWFPLWLTVILNRFPRNIIMVRSDKTVACNRAVMRRVSDSADSKSEFRCQGHSGVDLLIVRLTAPDPLRAKRSRYFIIPGIRYPTTNAIGREETLGSSTGVSAVEGEAASELTAIDRRRDDQCRREQQGDADQQHAVSPRHEMTGAGHNRAE